MENCKFPTINIAFCTDKNFVVLTIVAITSIIRNKKTDTKLRIVVLANQITENQKRCFAAIDYGENAKIELINITSDTSPSSFESTVSTNWVTETTWTRYGIYNFLPDLEKILYSNSLLATFKALIRASTSETSTSSSLVLV